jgi:hypothetical protein
MRQFKAFLIIAVCAAFPAAALARGGGGHRSQSTHSESAGRVNSHEHVVHGYTKRDGTVVQGYHATDPNGTRNDNYSTRGNTNPYTGKEGTKPRDGE